MHIESWWLTALSWTRSPTPWRTSGDISAVCSRWPRSDLMTNRLTQKTATIGAVKPISMLKFDAQMMRSLELLYLHAETLACTWR